MKKNINTFYAKVYITFFRVPISTQYLPVLFPAVLISPQSLQTNTGIVGLLGLFHIILNSQLRTIF
jgi:hypothetical protein